MQKNIYIYCSLRIKIYCSLRMKSPAHKQKYECMRAQVDMRTGIIEYPSICNLTADADRVTTVVSLRVDGYSIIAPLRVF